MPARAASSCPGWPIQRQIERVVREVPLPLNVIAFPGAPPKAEWAARRRRADQPRPVPAPRADGSAGARPPGCDQLDLLTARFGKRCSRIDARTDDGAQGENHDRQSCSSASPRCMSPGDPGPVQYLGRRQRARVAKAGAKAIATGSASVAMANGFGDGEKLPMEFALANAQADCRKRRTAGDGRLRRRLFG